MSLRPEIRGFDLDRSGSLFGGGDEAVIREMTLRFDESGLARDDEVRATFTDALQRAIRIGLPLPDLDAESEVHVFLAVRLAGYGQDWLDLGSNHWKYSSFVEFYRSHASELDSRGRSLLRCFLKVRPIFGKQSAANWSYYGHLNHSDAATLRDSIRTWQEREEAEPNSGAAAFAEEMAGWLDAIDGRSQDLWFWFA